MVIRVLVVDDEPLIRTGIGLILAAETDLEVVGQAEDGERALAEARRSIPDVVLMDVRMPRMDGVEATRRLLDEDGPSATDLPTVLVLSTYQADDLVRAALRAGASGFVLKDCEPDELVQAIREVAGGGAWLDPAVAKRLLLEFKGRADSVLPLSPQISMMTPREREVLILMAHGLSNPQIARHLVVAAGTVKTHVNRILTKLAVHERSQAVALAYRTRLVAPDDPLPMPVR